MSQELSFIPIAEPDIGEAEEKYLLDAYRSGWISSLGNYLERFETSFSSYCGAQHGVAVSNGTVALQLALLAAGVGVGDEVIVPSLTFVATAAAVLHTGAKPVFVDCEPEIGTMDPAAFECAITPKTKAVIPVHLYGHPADMDEIMSVAARHNLVVIEDAAEAHGARYKGKLVGSIGHMATFSFYGNKILTTGEGGMVLTSDDRYATKIRFLKDHAMDPSRKYWHPEVGYNFRMTNLQAAIGCAQLERVDDLLEKRRFVVDCYKKELTETPSVLVNPRRGWAEPVPWLVCAILPKGTTREQRDCLIKDLRARGIDSRPYFNLASDMPPYVSFRTPGDLHVSSDLSARGLNLPTSTMLTAESISFICGNFIELVEKIQRR